jgi:hypothetical protein
MTQEEQISIIEEVNEACSLFRIIITVALMSSQFFFMKTGNSKEGLFCMLENTL